MAKPDGVADWSVSASLEFDDRALWIFGVLVLIDGTVIRGAAAVVRSADGVCAGQVELARGMDGRPQSFLSLAEAEQVGNGARSDGKSLALVPQTGFTAGGRGYLFYDRVLLGSRGDQVERLGTGLCKVDAGTAACTRIADASGNYTLWPGDGLPVRAALVEGDMVYLLACSQPAALEAPCTLSRVALDQVESPVRYQRYNAFSSDWVAAPALGTEVLESLGPVTLGFLPFHRRFAAVLADPFAGTLSIRLSTDLTRSFGAPLSLFEAAPPGGERLLAGGLEHQLFRAGGGQVIHVSYATTKTSVPELHLAAFRFRGELE